MDTSFLNGEQRVSHSPDEITTATTTTTTTTTTAPSTARSASSAGPSNAAAHFLDGAEHASSSLAPVSAVSAPTSNPFVVVSNSRRPDTAGSSASGSRSRPSTAPGAAGPPPPPAGPPPPAVSDAEAQLQRAIRIEKRRMSRKAALAAHKMGSPGTDAYPTTEDEMAAMNADEESDGEHGSDDGEDAYVGPEIDIHSAFPVPPTSHPVPIPHPDSSAAPASGTSSKRPFSPKGLPQRSPPSSFVMPGAPTPSPWNLMRRKASDVSTVSASTSSASSSRISGSSSAGSQSAPTGRRRAGSDATGSTDGPLTPPATGPAGSFNGSLSVGIVGGAFAVVNTNSSELLPPPGRLLDRIDESGTSGPPQTALPPVPDMKRQMQAPYINVPPEPRPMANLIDTRRPSAASSDSGYVGPSTYTHSTTSAASPRPSQVDRLASPHPNPRDVHPDSELDVPGPRTGHRQTGSISGGSGGARSVATSDVPLQRNLTGTSSGDSMGSVSGLPYTSPMSPIPGSKIDKQVEKARKNLEKLEKKAREQAAKDEKKAQENAEKMRKKITAQSAQEMFDRGRYMGVLGFR